MSAEAICIIPARGGSKRLPRKNILPFHNGEPIIAKPIRAALESRLFTEVIVSSDDDEILNIAHDLGAHAIPRPAYLAGDDVDELGAYKDVLGFTPCEFFCAIYPTAAFVTPATIRRAFAALQDDHADVAMGVTKFKQHPYQMLRKVNDFYSLAFPCCNEILSYPEAYASNGSLYWFRTKEFLENQTYYPPRLTICEVESVDINTIDDFKLAEAIYANR